MVPNGSTTALNLNCNRLFIMVSHTVHIQEKKEEANPAPLMPPQVTSLVDIYQTLHSSPWRHKRVITT